MAFLSSLFGQKERTKRVPLFQPQQEAVLDQLLSQAAPAIQQQIGQQGTFEPIAQEARRQFQQQTIPSIAERFTALGGQRSGAFPQQLGAAGAGLESQLAAQQAQFGQQERAQQLGLLQNLLGLGLQPREKTFIQPAQPGFLGDIAAAITPAATLGLTLGAGGGFGTPTGLGGLAQLLTGRRSSSQQTQQIPQENMPLIGLLAALSQQRGGM